MNRAAIGFIVIMSIPGVAHAQAPVITSNGDPSINDSIVYAGAVQPSNYPGQPYVLLFDDGVARLDVNGSRQVTYRQVVQILTQKGAERWGELEYHYNPDRAGFRLNWLRVRLNGELVSDGPAFQQETMPDVSLDAPVYTDVRIQRMTVAGLEPGAILDVSYTYETFRPAYADDFRFTWMINQMVDVRRSRFIVDVPQDVAPRVFERNLPDGVREYVADGRRVLEWHAEALPAIEWEPLAGWPNDIAMTVSVSSQLTWDDISGWYHDLSHDHYSLNADVRHALAEQLVDAHSVRDSILAVHRWVAQDFRYVSLSLGDGGYKPRTPAAIFETKFGDCKDKATLFIGVLADWGIVAYPVLARSSGRVDSLVPTMLTFDHMIAAVETPRGREYADLTSAITPFGRLPYELQGGTALLVRPDEGEIVTLPVDDAKSSLREVYVTGELTADGSFDGGLAMRVTGVEEFALRQIIGNLADLDEADIVSLGEELTNEYFARAVVDSAEVLDGHDLTTPPSITTWFSVSDAVTWSGEKVVLSLPLPDYTMDTWVSELEADSIRQFPIATKDFNGPSRHRTEFVVVLPPGWRAELPPNVEVEGTFGVYRSVYVQQGRTVRAMREMSGRRGNEPPDSIAVLKAWMRAVSQDRAEYVVIEKLADTATKDSLDAVVSVPLVFSWPIGMKTRVRQRYTQIRTGAGGVADTTVSELSHRMGVREHELGRLIVFDDHQLEHDSGQMDLDVEGVSEFLGRLSPSFVVDDTGNLLTFEDWDAFIETTRELIQPMLDSLEPGVLGLRDVMDRFLTEEFIYSKAMELWGPLVYFWSETEMEVGVPYESESDEPSPLYPETLIPYNYVHKLESRVPCTVGTTDSACVRLSMTSRADPEAVGKLLTQLFADMLRDGGDIISAMESMDVTSTVTLVAEPETLIPHHLTVAQNVSTTMRDSTGTVSSNNQLRKREYRFEHREFQADLAHPSELFRAASSGDHDAVAKAIENGADLEQRDPNGRTPLIAAAAGGHGAVVRLLVSGGAHVNATDRTGTSALFWAAKTGQDDVSDLLVREGADVRLAYVSIRANGDIDALHGLIRVGLSPPPRPIDGLRSSARAFYNAGNLAEALPLFVDVVAQDTSDANSIAWVAEVQRRLNQPQLAVASARMAIERVECHGHALNVIAAAYNPRHSHWDHVNADTSWVYLQRSVECAPEDGNGWLELVYSSAERGLFELQRDALGHLASTGFFPPSALAAARWTLQDLPEGACCLLMVN